MSLVWINGTLVDKLQARVSPFDHGFLYGDGVWQHFRVFGGKLFRPTEPINWLYTTAREALGMTMPLTREAMIAAIEATVTANNRSRGYVRAIVSRGPGTIGPDPRKIDPQVIIIAEDYHPFPLELYGHGLHAIVLTDTDLGYDSTSSHRLLGQPRLVTAKRFGLKAGVLDVVLPFQGPGCYGCTEGVLFMVEGNRLMTVDGPPADVVAVAAQEIATAAGFRLTRGVTTPEALLRADELFLAGTTAGIIGIIQLDGTAIGSGQEGPVTRLVRAGYEALQR